MDNKKLDILKDFIKFCKKELNIQSLPPIKLIKDTSFVSNNRSFGSYNPSEGNEIKVFILNRNLADICRSLAHELTHHRQNELNMIQKGSGDTGSDIEDEANAMAGILMRDYGKLNYSVYDLDNPKKLSEARETDKYYFAYGRNMRIEAFEAKYSSAKAQKLVLAKGWDLTFDKTSITNKGSVVSDIVEAPSLKVFGILYTIGNLDFQELDKQEGGYERIGIRVTDLDGNDYEAVTYTVIDKKNFLDEVPKTTYVNELVKGLKDAQKLGPEGDNKVIKSQLKLYGKHLLDVYKLSKTIK